MTQYEFRLSLRSNDPKVVFTGKYLHQFDDMRHRILSKMVDSEYPIALCLDPTKTNEEVLLATIESISNDLARTAYKVNFIKASRGMNITPDMLSNFGLLPSIQYLSGEPLIQGDDRQVTVAPLASSIVESKEISIVEKLPDEEEEEDEEEDEDEDYDPYEGMSNEEYLAATAHLVTLPVMKG